MPGRVTVLTPLDSTPAVELGASKWRKKILPLGALDYEGRTLQFTRPYLDSLVDGFKAKAFDAVPFQVAEKHSNDPKDTQGQITDLEVTDDGLYGVITAGDAGSALIKENPNLGVSVRIVEGHERQDGATKKYFPAALQHVLGTWVPRMSGMGGWSAVACTQESTSVLDLSELTFTGGPPASGAQTAPAGGTNQEGAAMPPILTAEEQSTLTALLAKLNGGGVAPPAAPPTAPAAQVAGPTLQATQVPAPAATQAPAAPAPAAPAPAASGGDGGSAAVTGVAEAFTAEELAAMAGVIPPTVPPPAVTPAAPTEVAPVLAGTAVAASGAPGNAVELNALQIQRDADAVELAHVRNELSQARWERESSELTARLGIPPSIVALAAPLLHGTGNAVELAHGSPTEPVRAQRELAGRITRELLAAVAKTYGSLVDLSGPLGTSHDASQASAEAAARDEFMTRARAQGIGQ